MPTETRAAKRSKTSNAPAQASVGPGDLQTRLRELNTLSTTEFQQEHIPKHLLTYNSTKLPSGSITLEYCSASELSKQDLDKCFQLLVQTSREDYEDSSRGWHPEHKRAEMLDMNMRYLIVRSSPSKQQQQQQQQTPMTASTPIAASRVSQVDGSHTTTSTPASTSSRTSTDTITTTNPALDTFGFLSFQLDDDWTLSGYRVPILYLYEIHLGRSLRGTGLGKYLMNLARHIAAATSMAKVELSVFRSNMHAEDFYRGLGYVTDETSPRMVKKGRKRMKPDWLVLSLPIKTEPSSEESDDEGPGPA
ncbi:hypothetical protein BT63DRAFT_173449 [Microthyrium microscopicum]|uniref:N-alpha-acetyltransferase 40 n=1 Tax=Microthyrium microscopicum TaxID=703497 RepID=A0A6A6UH17_9PEZI|nr:hypothetical protein BT63DRAFT_173449 [Microthyrium microscopicum]